MKTLILLTALAAIATAGPTFLGKDTIDQDSPLNGILKTIKRERKSPVQESPSDLLSDALENSETLPSSDARASNAGRNSGFKKPIIVKKKFGYRIYRDSDEELAQAEPRENCRSQFRFKLCDDSSDQLSTALRTTQTEDIDESDVEQSLRMAKEAVEILQRDLLKIERNTKLAQKKLAGDKFEEKIVHVAKENSKHEERFGENNGEATKWKTSALSTDPEISNSDEKRTAEWKEALENIQNNVGIVKNTEEISKISNINNFEEENSLMKSRKTENIDSTVAKQDSDLLTIEKSIETKQDTPKSAEENMETYATESKDVKIGLLSDSLKIEKAASLETSDILRNVESDQSLIRESKHNDIPLNLQGKSSEKLLDSSHEVKSAIINNVDLMNWDGIGKDVNFAPKLAQSSETDLKNDARSTSTENIEEKSKLQSNIEHDKVMREDENKNKDVEAKAASEEIKSIKETTMEVKDAEISESRNSDMLINAKKSETLTENKEKSAISWLSELEENKTDLKAKSSDSKIELLGDRELLQRTANEKSENTNLNVPIRSNSLEVEQKNMREAAKSDENLWNIESISGKTDEHVDSLKLREAQEADEKNIVTDIIQPRKTESSLEDSHMVTTQDENMRKASSGEEKQWAVEPTKHLNKSEELVDTAKLREAEDVDEKLELSDVVQARNVENEDTERLFESKKHTEEKSAVISSTATFDNALSQELNKEKSLYQKSVETENDDKQKVNLKTSKNLEHLEINVNQHNKQDLVKERHTLDETKTSPFGESTELRGHLPQNHNVDSERLHNKENVPSMKMSEMEYYNDLGNQHSAQLIQDKNIDIHSTTHLKDTVSNWNRDKYYHNIRESPYLVRWPYDRMRSDGHLDSNPGHLHLQHHHMGNMHSEEEPHRFLPMGRFGNNHPMEHQHDLLNNPAITENIQESGRASEWDIAMEPSMNMDMRHAVDKNGVPWSFHRHAGFGSGIPLGGPVSGGPGAVGLFPGANTGCGIPLLLSCSPSVVSGSLAKSQSLRFNDPSFRSGDDSRFYTKRDVKTHDEIPANAKNYFITSA